MQSFAQDPITTTWMLALLVLFTVVVAIPLLRAVVAGLIYAYAHATGRHQLRATAARVMPRLGRLIGSVVVGVASIAAPAAATTADVSAISVDRDGGQLRTTPRAETPPQPQASTATPQVQATAEVSLASTHLYVVRSGDSLWSIAASQLQSPTDAEITEQWKAIWRANRRAIGDQPEFIRPGIQLVVDGASA